MTTRNIVGKGLQPVYEANPATVIYFIPFIIIGWMFIPKVRPAAGDCRPSLGSRP